MREEGGGRKTGREEDMGGGNRVPVEDLSLPLETFRSSLEVVILPIEAV
jgi:hypothetical protein